MATKVVQKSSEPGPALGLDIFFAVGGGLSKQTYLDREGTFDLATEVGWSVVDGLRVSLAYGARFGSQRYLSRNPDPMTYEPRSVEVEEQFWELGAGVGFDVLRNRWYEVLPWLGAEVSMTPTFLAWANDVFGSWAMGIRLGVKLHADLADHLRVGAWSGWLAPFVDLYSNTSLAGGADHVWDYGVNLSWGFGGMGPFRSWSLQVCWRGKAVVFEHALRHYNAALMGVSTRL